MRPSAATRTAAASPAGHQPGQSPCEPSRGAASDSSGADGAIDGGGAGEPSDGGSSSGMGAVAVVTGAPVAAGRGVCRAAGSACNPSGTSIGGVSAVGAGSGRGLAVGVGVGCGPSRREAGTSGATGPCTSDGGVGWSGGRRKSLTWPAAGALASRATGRASLVQDIVVPAPRQGALNSRLTCAAEVRHLVPRARTRQEP